MSGMDIAVLGGGPAGLAAALALRQRGCRVALYDAQRPPIDKACGEGLMPEAVRLLRELGLAVDNKDGAPFDGISFHDAHTNVRAAFGTGCGLGMRRTALQGRMAALAARMGVTLHWNASVQTAAGGGFAAAGAPIDADFFVIADGQCSTLAAASGFRERTCYSERYASRQHFQIAPWSRTVEVHWGRQEQLYVTPLGNAEVGVALLTGDRRRRLSDVLPDFPAVANRLACAARSSTMRGAVTRTRSLREVVRGNIALLGDASGSVDAVTGEGLLAALRQAHALADAVAASAPQRYEAAHRQMAKAPQRMARLLLLLDRSAWLQRRFVATLAARPQSFAALLRVHLEEESWRSFAMKEGWPLLAGALTAGRSTSAWPPYALPRKERGL